MCSISLPVHLLPSHPVPLPAASMMLLRLRHLHQQRLMRPRDTNPTPGSCRPHASHEPHGAVMGVRTGRHGRARVHVHSRLALGSGRGLGQVLMAHALHHGMGRCPGKVPHPWACEGLACGILKLPMPCRHELRGVQLLLHCGVAGVDMGMGGWSQRGPGKGAGQG